ncbi:interleukin 17-like protein isoform X2 [Octopus sinensis]|uniref:Interleukin 17-like protein isoform X2 n=1 Tax=Octopus sinensis TaxID=2607531 RepID=A0A7E6EYU7_9MOLL|nr:interleukin 17-like protein isoform X2 [Octopus sinensis]
MLYKVLVQIVILFFNYLVIVSSASIPTQCKIPTNLQVRFKSLPSEVNSNNFFLPAEMAPTESSEALMTDENKTHPTSAGLSTDIGNRSTCPWSLNIIHNSTYFPPTFTEVVCRCKTCLDSDKNHRCTTLYSKMTVLKRTGECINGWYVYKPSVIDVATACVCARRHNAVFKVKDNVE